MLLRALRPFVSHPEVLCTVVVLPERWATDPPEWLAGLTGGGLRIVAGGAERMDSAERGIEALPAECAVVLVHDAARPFVSPDTVDRVIAAARLGGGAIAAAPLGDTLKECDDAAAPLVRRTIPREGLWRAQTPQGFPGHCSSARMRPPAETGCSGRTSLCWSSGSAGRCGSFPMPHRT